MSRSFNLGEVNVLMASEKKRSIKIFVHKKEELKIDERKFQNVDAALRIIRTKKA